MSKGSSGPDMSGQNEAAKQLADIAREMWDSYKTTYQPMEQKFAEDAANYDTPQRREQMAGQANADVEGAYSRMREEQDRDLSRMGVEVDPTKLAAISNRLNIAQAGAQAGAQNNARNYVENMGWARRQDAISLGKGMPGQAVAGLQAAGNQYGQAAQLGIQRQQGEVSQLAGGVGGMYGLGHDAGWWGADGGLVPSRKSLSGPSGGPQNLSGIVPSGGVARRPVRLAYGGPAGAMQMLQQSRATASGGGGAQGVNPMGIVAQGVGAARTGMQAYKMGKGLYNMVDTGIKNAMTPASPGEADAILAGNQVAGSGAGGAGTDLLGMTGGNEIVGSGLTGIGDAAAAAAPAAADAAAAATAATTAMKVSPEILAALALLADGGRVNGIAGGKVTGPGTETSDSVPAQLSAGEYVLNAEAVKHFGLDRLNKMNEVGLRKRYGIK